MLLVRFPRPMPSWLALDPLGKCDRGQAFLADVTDVMRNGTLIHGGHFKGACVLFAHIYLSIVLISCWTFI